MVENKVNDSFGCRREIRSKTKVSNRNNSEFRTQRKDEKYE
ncbi:MAG: hypothetical protein ACI4DK_02965 [Lachnospiraceae bacterium]